MRPGFPWAQYMQSAGLGGVQKVVLRQNTGLVRR
jgi:hypothetical protein